MTRKATDQVTTIGVDIGKTASTPSAFMAALGPGCVKTRMPRPSAQQLNPEGNVDESLLRRRPNS